MAFVAAKFLSAMVSGRRRCLFFLRAKVERR